MYAATRIREGRFDQRGWTNEASLANLMLTKPDKINQMMTYTYGYDDSRFPLLFQTEGQGAVTTVNEGTWTWDVMGRQKFHDFVSYFDTSDTEPGKGGRPFEVHFKTALFIEQYGLVAPDGNTYVRIMKDCGKSAYGFKYILRIKDATADSFIDPENLIAGKFWSLTAPTIPLSFSKGNRSNSMGPGKMMGQLGYHRFTKIIAGNVANTIVEYQFRGKNGGTENRWINEEMRQFEVLRRVMMEEHLWRSRYNRTVNGEITMHDDDTGNPIPETAGMIEICKESNYDTYGERLTLNKLKRTILDVFHRDTDTGTMEVVLYGGRGFRQDFEEAIRSDAKANGFIEALGYQMIQSSGSGMVYGKYFDAFKMLEGHTVVYKYLPFLDHGTDADRDKANNNIHPISGLPMSSHRVFCIDHSMYDGERNVRFTKQKGQETLIGILKGLTPIPESWGTVPMNEQRIATEIDKSEYHVKSSMGLHVTRTDKMFALESVI